MANRNGGGVWYVRWENDIKAHTDETEFEDEPSIK